MKAAPKVHRLIGGLSSTACHMCDPDDLAIVIMEKVHANARSLDLMRSITGDHGH